MKVRTSIKYIKAVLKGEIGQTISENSFQFYTKIKNNFLVLSHILLIYGICFGRTSITLAQVTINKSTYFKRLMYFNFIMDLDLWESTENHSQVKVILLAKKIV